MTPRVLLELRLRMAGLPPPAGLELRPWALDSPNGRVLTRHKLGVRAHPEGLDLIGTLDDKRSPAVAFDDLVLPFQLVLRDPELALRLDLEPLRRVKHPTYFRRSSGYTLTLRAGAAPLPPDVLAGVVLDRVDAAWLRSSTPRRFVLALEPRDLYWVYYVTCSRSGPPPTILDADSTRALSFTCERLDPTRVERDPVGAALLARRPDHAVYRLHSDRAPPAFVQAPRGLTLRFDQHTVLANLPAPSLRDQLVLPLSDSKTRDAVYRVLET